MERTYFTEVEARREIGSVVEAASDFPAVPKGTRGTVSKANRYSKDKWAALVEWDVPRPSSYVLAMVLEASFNFPLRSKPVTDQFCKSEYETLVRVLQPTA